MHNYSRGQLTLSNGIRCYKSHVYIYSIHKEREKKSIFVVPNYIESQHFGDIYCDKYGRSDGTKIQKERERELIFHPKDNTDR